MAKATAGGTGAFNKATKKRKGVHSKTKTSNNKNAHNYKKSYKGQG